MLAQKGAAVSSELIALASALGIGALLKALVDWAINHRRNDIDIAKMSVEITASVMSQLRKELDAAHAELADAHREIEDLRAALAEARAELATYRKGN